MIDHIVDACREAGAARPIAVLNPAQPEVAEHLAERCQVVYQQQPRGTGHALAAVPGNLLKGDVLVVNGDAALLRPETMHALVERHRASSAKVTIASTVDPLRSDGRILRDEDGERRADDTADQPAASIIDPACEHRRLHKTRGPLRLPAARGHRVRVRSPCAKYTDLTATTMIGFRSL